MLNVAVYWRTIPYSSTTPNALSSIKIPAALAHDIFLSLTPFCLSQGNGIRACPRVCNVHNIISEKYMHKKYLPHNQSFENMSTIIPIIK